MLSFLSRHLADFGASAGVVVLWAEAVYGQHLFARPFRRGRGWYVAMVGLAIFSLVAIWL